jgi:hypothetical protein
MRASQKMQGVGVDSTLLSSEDIPIKPNPNENYGITMKKIYIIVGMLIVIFAFPTVAKELPVRIKQGMSYTQARKLLLKDGWKVKVAHTTSDGTPICYIAEFNEEYYESYMKKSEVCKYKEIENCSGTGMGFCEMELLGDDGTQLFILTIEGWPPDAKIYRWDVRRKEISETPARSRRIRIKKGMPYLQAKKLLLDDGWQAITAYTRAGGYPICFKDANLSEDDENYAKFNDSKVCEYVEIEACSDTGKRICTMKFFDGEDTTITVTTVGGEPPKAKIESFLEARRNTH